MIYKVYIQKFISISNTEIDYVSDNLNCITGESGTGKTVMLKSILYALCKQDYSSELKNEDVSVFVDFNDLRIHRARSKGKNIYKINGNDVKKEDILSVVNKKVQVISQNGNQILKNDSYPMSFVDDFVSHDDLKVYKEKYSEFQNRKNKIKKVESILKNRDEKIKDLKIKIEKIEDLELSINDDNLKESYRQIQENKKLFENVLKVHSLLENDEYSVINILREVNYLLKKDEELQIISHDIVNNLIKLQNSVEKEFKKHNKNEEEDLSERISNIEKVKHFFKVSSVKELMSLSSNYQNELKELENLEKTYDSLCVESETLERLLHVIADKLHLQRKQVCSQISLKMNQNFNDLMMQNTRFNADIKMSGEINSDGKSSISFEISSDKGATYKPIQMVASGGELSRILLSLAEINSFGKILIFDEIDNGIGGATGIVLSNKIYEMSKKNQVILITHLSHLAYKSDNHFVVDKDTSNCSLIKIVKDDDKMEEIGRMISGRKGETAILIAKEIMK